MATNATTDTTTATASDSTKVLSLPGALSFWHTINIPSEMVRLPLIAKGNIGLGPIYALVVATWFLLAITRHATFSIFHAGIAVVCILIIGEFLTALFDWITRSDVLIIDANGIFDKRQCDHSIPWSDVSRVTLAYSGRSRQFYAARLQLNHAINVRPNPFRLGTMGRSWFRKPNEIYISTLNMSVWDRHLALAIALLARESGAKIDDVLFYPGRDPLRHR